MIPSPARRYHSMNSLLLVDDEEAICLEFKQTLEGFGIRVEMAHTMESALDFARKTQFDAILVEFNMRSELREHPRAGNGLKLIRQLRALDITAPVLMFTAMRGEFYETASLDAGADDFLLKTVSIPILVSRIRALIRRHEQGLCRSTESERVSV
jgi:DNA-binding response OmpR family regulator